jgi:transposase
MKRRAREALSIREKASLLSEAAHIGVTAAARSAGVNRASIYRWRAKAARDGEDGLPPASRKGSALLANRLAPEIQAAVIEIARELPYLGPQRAAKELAQRGIVVSASAVHSTWSRHGLEVVPARAAAARKGIEDQPAPATNPELLAELSALRAAVAQLTEQQAHTMAAMDRRDRAGRATARPKSTTSFPSKGESSNTRGLLREIFGDALPAKRCEQSGTPPAAPVTLADKPTSLGVLSLLFGADVMANARPSEPDLPARSEGTEVV